MNRLIAALERIVKTTSGLSPVLYHYTSVSATAKILDSDRFELSTSIGTESEEDLRVKQKFYYLSTTRHKLGGFHKNAGHGVLLVLDGKALNQNYTGKAIDYWGENFRKIDPTKFEAEDRVWSREPYIEPASKYITEVHVIDETLEKDAPEDSRGNYLKRALKKLLITAKKQGIPAYVYTDRSAFKTLNKAKAKTLEELDLKTGPKEEPDWPRVERRSRLSPWIELYYKTNKNELSKDAKYTQRSLNSGYRDKMSGLKNDIHNNKSNPKVIKPFVDILKKEKWTSVKEFFEYLEKKWR